MSAVYYSLLANLRGRACVVVGGGEVAERKIESLLEAEAAVTVVSPAFTERIRTLAADGRIVAVEARYDESHLPLLRKAVLVYAATGDSAVNEAVNRDGASLGKLVNAADDPEGNGFIVPSVLRRGKLIVSVSTSGASPGVAASIRRSLEDSYGDEYEPYLDLLDKLRRLVLGSVADSAVRRDLLRRLLDWKLLEAARSGALGRLADIIVERVRQEPTAETFDYIKKLLEQEAAGFPADG